MQKLNSTRIAVVGLGYVGLPLAVEFSEKFPTVGFDSDPRRIRELTQGEDLTREIDKDRLINATELIFTADLEAIRECNVYIITVPTPVDEFNNPDTRHLVKASQTVATVIDKGDVIIFESTVYPGATENLCVPEIEQTSGLKFNHDFFVGYSPERINPGDYKHRLTDVVKLTSGSTSETLQFVDALYATIISAGTHPTSNIAIAEAAKVIENTQRDVNIALINELAIIFHKLGLDTGEILEAAGTKWNFLPFEPGLVGGHCIGVDPYYLTHRARETGYQPELILAGRRINDSMGAHIAQRTIKLMSLAGIDLAKAKVLILGLSFKENCPDLRNSKVIDIYREMTSYGLTPQVFDPWADPSVAKREYGIDLINATDGPYDSLVLAVAHSQFQSLDIPSLVTPVHVVFDAKRFLPRESVTERL